MADNDAELAKAVVAIDQEPIASWADAADFQAVSLDLARLFRDNFTKYEAMCSPDVLARGGPLS